jgi:nitroreductase
MKVYETIRTILAVREYKDKAIPAEVVHRIVEAGRLTGSSMNLQPWHFIVVEERTTLLKLGELATTGPYVAQAALAIVVAIEKDSHYAVSDASRAIQSMFLTAWEAGVGSNWVGFSNIDSVKPLLEITAEMDVLAILPFGYPKQSLGEGIKNRKPLSQVASKGKFGRPLN